GAQGDLLNRRLPTEFPNQLFDIPEVPIQPFDDMNGQAHQFRLIDDRPLDELANPPGRVGTEAEPTLVIELLDGLDQPKITLLDDVGEGKSTVHVAFANADHQPQVRLNHLGSGLFIAGHDPLAELL